jgi:hypothetical protein
LEAIVVAAPGKHRKPEARPPLASTSALFEDHPSAPQPRVLDRDWTPPYVDYPSWPLPGEYRRSLPERRGGRGGEGRRALPGPHPDQAPHPLAGPSEPPASAAGWETLAAYGVGTYDPGPQRHLAAGHGPGVLPESQVRYPNLPGSEVRGALATPAGPAGQLPGLPSLEDSLRLANGIIADADSEAAGIMADAAARADAARATAEREAAGIREEASAQAAEMRASAAQGAADLRQLAQSVLQSLTASGGPIAGAAAAPATRPAGRPSTGAAGRPAARSATATRPAARPGAAPGSPPAPGPAVGPRTRQPGGTRQALAMRKVAACVAALCLLGAATGGSELALHGWKFFVFRGGGVGQTSGTETDQQFLARQAAAARRDAAPAGRHHKSTHAGLEVHH